MAWTSKYYAAQKAADPLYIKRKNLARYGLTFERFEEMITEQNKECAICEKEFVGAACVDHDHKTGEIRGLLCRACNSKLGWFEDKFLTILNYIGEV